jgi:UDP-N-acetylglucosamine 2-epimerase (non-hydrolysing)
MSDIFFRDLDLPEPDVYLGVGSDSHAVQTARVMMAFEPTLLNLNPDLVIVVGDVNSTLACALAAVKCRVPVAHVEAGLRSLDRRMPEEINRLATDSVATLLFASEPSGMAHLKAEGVPEDRCFFVGNVMIDTLAQSIDRARQRPILDGVGVLPGAFFLVTLHRPSNVDDPVCLRDVVDLLVALSRQKPVVFPVHPRTRERLRDDELLGRLHAAEGLVLTPPLGYLDFLCLMDAAAVVITDSGGIQEETSFLGVPCLTVRPTTERPITIEQGTNELVPLDAVKIGTRAAALAATARKAPAPLPLWDGHAAHRIVEVLTRVLPVQT